MQNVAMLYMIGFAIVGPGSTLHKPLFLGRFPIVALAAVLNKSFFFVACLSSHIWPAWPFFNSVLAFYFSEAEVMMNIVSYLSCSGGIVREKTICGFLFSANCVDSFENRKMHTRS